MQANPDQSADSGHRVYPKHRVYYYAALALVSLSVDLGSKEIAFSKLGLYQHSDWILDSWLRFRIQTSLNEGALWGMGQGFAPVFALLSVIAVVGIIYWLFFKGAARSAWLTTSLGLVTGGTLGNLYDRLALHGVAFPDRTEPAQAVRDFLHFIIGSFDWPIFNLADSFLVIGAIMMMAQSFRQSAESSEEVSDSTATASAMTQK